MPAGHYIPRGLVVRGGGDFTTDLNLSAGGVDEAVSVASSGTDLVSYGIHYFSGTTATYLLDAPEVGRVVRFVGAGATGSTHTVVCDTTSVLFMSSSGAAAARQFAANGGFGLEVVGSSAAVWAVLNARGNVTFSSST